MWRRFLISSVVCMDLTKAVWTLWIRSNIKRSRQAARTSAITFMLIFNRLTCLLAEISDRLFLITFFGIG